MINGSVIRNTTSPELKRMLRKINDRSKLFKTWGTVVLNKARRNARAKGGRKLWRTIADMTRLTSVSNDGAVVECLSYIGAHKEFGGPIRAKNKAALTIPIHELARGRTSRELALDLGVKLFVPKNTNVLGYSDNGTFVGLYALRTRTASQRPDPWWVGTDWALQKGIEEARWHIEKGH